MGWRCWWWVHSTSLGLVCLVLWLLDIFSWAVFEPTELPKVKGTFWADDSNCGAASGVIRGLGALTAVVG